MSSRACFFRQLSASSSLLIYTMNFLSWIDFFLMVLSVPSGRQEDCRLRQSRSTLLWEMMNSCGCCVAISNSVIRYLVKGLPLSNWLWIELNWIFFSIIPRVSFIQFIQSILEQRAQGAIHFVSSVFFPLSLSSALRFVVSSTHLTNSAVWRVIFHW